MNEYPEIQITPEMVQQAYDLGQRMGRLNRSIMQGERNIAGFLGEIVFEQYYPESVRTNTYHHDFIFHGAPIDVKTKVRSARPKPFFEVTIPAYHLQNTHAYFFISLLQSNQRYTSAFLLGWETSEEFLRKAKFMKKGQYDPSNDFLVREDCYNLPIHELRQVKRKPGETYAAEKRLQQIEYRSERKENVIRRIPTRPSCSSSS